LPDLPSQFAQIVGETGVLSSPADLIHYGQDWTRFHDPSPSAIVFPDCIDQVVDIVQLARRHGLALVPSGGRTGLSGGACATQGEVVISFEKMNRILEFSATDASVTLQPGVITAQLQTFAEERGFYYPIDFASSGSSQLGGNISTNAGGIRVLRYGMTRNWVSGLKVVTGKGELITLNRGLAKNNTGYDLRHLFIGSEGTLGFIVEATVQLAQAPEDSSVLLLAVPKMESCTSILEQFRARITLNAFEFFSEGALQAVMRSAPLPHPFDNPSEFYVLLEYEAGDSSAHEAATTAFDHCMAKGWATDGVLGQSHQQNASIWQYRERISESITPRTPYKNDLSVRISQVPAFLAKVDDLVTKGYPGFEVVWFGHIGDGNLHLNILKPEDWRVDQFKRACDEVSQAILALVADFGGSVSAEHGIGLLKRDQLSFTRSGAEIDAMRAIKQVFDPDGIMNPGKLLQV
jgi:FAD/FMN-containing dehydrogenase